MEGRQCWLLSFCSAGCALVQTLSKRAPRHGAVCDVDATFPQLAMCALSLPTNMHGCWLDLVKETCTGWQRLKSNPGELQRPRLLAGALGQRGAVCVFCSQPHIFLLLQYLPLQQPVKCALLTSRFRELGTCRCGAGVNACFRLFASSEGLLLARRRLLGQHKVCQQSGGLECPALPAPIEPLPGGLW